MMVPAGTGAVTPVRTQRKPAARTKHAPEFPTLDVERGFLSPGVTLLAGVDEVGRGALAGPVSVGIAVVDLRDHGLLAGVRDSKLLKPEDRERLEPLVREWAVGSAVGHASSVEIDTLGIVGRLAPCRNARLVRDSCRGRASGHRPAGREPQLAVAPDPGFLVRRRGPSEACL